MMIKISNFVAGGKEDKSSLLMQKWGYDNKFYLNSNRKY